MAMPDPERECYLLGIPVHERAVLRPAGRDWVTQARSPQQAVDELGSLYKRQFEELFGSLPDGINGALLDQPPSRSTFENHRRA